MITGNINTGFTGIERPTYKMAELGIGPMSSPAGNGMRIETGRDKQGTTHIHIRITAPWEKQQ